MKFFPKILTFLSLLGCKAAALPKFYELMTPTAPLQQRASQALERVTDFGPNKSNTKMYIYVPKKLADPLPIIVAIHYCHGTASSYYSGAPYPRLADQKGFIVIYPESPYSDGCWDISSRGALTHDGGGDSNSIANMVNYTLNKYSGDPTKVYVLGVSSGAMMTNVMAATYPELFAAGIVYSGVPAGCFYSQSGGEGQWNSTCAQGQVHNTQEQWAQTAHNMYPSYNGSRPRLQIYHGSADDTLYPSNFNETIKQWCGVFGFDHAKPDSTKQNTPQAGYTTYTWGEEQLVGIYAAGVGHNVPIRGDDDMKFLGL